MKKQSNILDDLNVADTEHRVQMPRSLQTIIAALQRFKRGAGVHNKLLNARGEALDVAENAADAIPGRGTIMDTLLQGTEDPATRAGVYARNYAPAVLAALAAGAGGYGLYRGGKALGDKYASAIDVHSAYDMGFADRLAQYECPATKQAGVRDLLDSAGDYAEDVYDTAKDKGGELWESGKETGADLIERIRTMMRGSSAAQAANSHDPSRVASYLANALPGGAPMLGAYREGQRGGEHPVAAALGASSLSTLGSGVGAVGGGAIGLLLASLLSSKGYHGPMPTTIPRLTPEITGAALKPLLQRAVGTAAGAGLGAFVGGGETLHRATD